MQRNTEYNKYTYIHNICTYNISPQLLPTSRSSTKADGNRSRITRRKHAWKLVQIRKQRKTALYIALVDLHRLRTAENRTKSARNQPLTSYIKMWKNVITSHFFESLLFSLKYSRPQKITILTAWKLADRQQVSSDPRQHPRPPDPRRHKRQNIKFCLKNI